MSSRQKSVVRTTRVSSGLQECRQDYKSVVRSTRVSSGQQELDARAIRAAYRPKYKHNDQRTLTSIQSNNDYNRHLSNEQIMSLSQYEYTTIALAR